MTIGGAHPRRPAQMLLRWGLPYFIGRLYIKDWVAARELAVAVFVAAVAARLGRPFHDDVVDQLADGLGLPQRLALGEDEALVLGAGATRKVLTWRSAKGAGIE